MAIYLSDFQQEFLSGLEEDDDSGGEGDHPRLLQVRFHKHPSLLEAASPNKKGQVYHGFCHLFYDCLSVYHTRLLQCIEQHQPIKPSHDFYHRSKEEKAAEKDRLGVLQDKYGFCMMDGHKQKVANFRYTK